MLTVGICGVCGRMGGAVLRELRSRGHTLGAAFDAPSSRFFGSDAAVILNTEPLGVVIRSLDEGGFAGLDGVIDFSSPAASVRCVELALAAGKPLVIGTTGLSAEQRTRVEAAGAHIPLLLSPNMSVGVNLLFRLAEIAAATLGKDFDVEVFEAHHRFKKDAPSGTARRLIDIVKSSSKRLSPAAEAYDRSRGLAERGDEEIGVMTLRGGDIVGEHTLYFIGMGERLELTHRAQSRDILSRGAVKALEFLIAKKPGLYSMFDVLGI